MKLIRSTSKNNPIFINLPIPLFGFLLKVWAFFAMRPAFTVSQLEALTAGDKFEVIVTTKGCIYFNNLIIAE